MKRGTQSLHSFHPRRSTNGELLGSVPVLREVACYTVSGFVIHRDLDVEELFTVSHFETGTMIASGASPVLAMRAVCERKRRQSRRWGLTSGRAIFQRGIKDAWSKISRLGNNQTRENQ